MVFYYWTNPNILEDITSILFYSNFNSTLSSLCALLISLKIYDLFQWNPNFSYLFYVSF
jgi:hypothetical protein